MRRQGISQREVSALSGNSNTTILRILQGYNTSVATLADVAGALGCRLKFTLEKIDVS